MAAADALQVGDAAGAPEAVAVTVVHGARDAWRARILESLAASRPPGERWALLRTGVALPGARSEALAGLVVHEAGAACACCIGRVALRVTLTRLLRDARRHNRPLQALLVDAGATADPQALDQTLLAPGLADRLVIAQRLLVLDPVAAVRLLAEAATPPRARLQAQLAVVDEILLVEGGGSDGATDTLRAAAPRARRIALLA